MTTAQMTGWSHSKFGKQDALSAETLLCDVAEAALSDAGLEPEAIDAIFVGTFNGGFVYQDFPSSLVFNRIPGLRFKPAVRVENACATGSAALYAAMDAIDARRARHALVIGYEKMTELTTSEIGKVLLKCSYATEEAGPGGFAGVFGGLAQRYFERYGDQSDALARIAAKNHLNGTQNPYAQLRKDLGFDFCRNVSEKNPIVAGPLKRTDCSLVSDGAAAIVVSSADAARGMRKAVRFRAAVQVNDYLPLSRRDDPIAFEGGQLAWKKALDQAGLRLTDLSMVESHDCFTIAELIEYEAMGLAPRGQGARVIAEGLTAKDGALPINPSGGLKSKGHPIGATGVSMHVLAAMQVTDEAGGMQIPNAKLAGVFNMGGAAVANYVSILERVK